MKIPDDVGGVSWPKIFLGAGGATVLLVVIKLLNESSHLGYRLLPGHPGGDRPGWSRLPDVQGGDGRPSLASGFRSGAWLAHSPGGVRV